MPTDNVSITAGSGTTIRTLADASGNEWQAVVCTYATTVSAGANVLQPVTTGAGLPVAQQGSWTVTATLSSSTNAGAAAKTSDYDTGAGTDTVTLFGIALPASGGAVAGGTSSNPLQVSLANTAANSTAVKVDGSAVTQPVSGTVGANVTQIVGAAPGATNPLPVRLTDGTSYLASGTEYSEGDTAATPRGSVAMWAAGTTIHAASTANPLPVSQKAAGSASATLQSAVSATGNGSTLSTDGQSSVVFTVTGTFTATVNFEGTEDGTNYTALTVNQLGTATLATGTTTTGVFQASCAGLQNVRARVTWTSGTSVTVTAHAVPVPHTNRTTQANQAGTWTVQPGNTANTTAWLVTGTGGTFPATQSGAWTVQPGNTANTTAWLVTGTGGTFPATQSGTWTVQPGNTANTTPWLVAPSAATSGGASASKVISAASTNATSVKASAGQVYGLMAFNNNATSARYLKLYDKASAPTVGTDTPVAVLMIPAGGGAVPPLPVGLAFASGIALAITGGIADSDATAISANECAVTILYK